jgi:DNA-binding IclR family transcriptional regulator
MTTTNKPYPGTQAVLRAVSILKAFTDETPEWGLTELAAEVGLNKTTAFRLLTALESEGMIARNGRDGYMLGPEIAVLGGRVLRHNDLRNVVKPALIALVAETGETASLDILVGDEILIMDEVMGEHLMGSLSSLGTRHPAYATSTGKAILAYLPANQVAAILARPLTPITPQTITSSDLLNQQLAQIRERGYAIADQELEAGLIVVGAPLFNHDGQVVGAICLGAPNIRFTPERIPDIGALVQKTAADISAQLGYRP